MKIPTYFFIFLFMVLTILTSSFASLDSSTKSYLIATAPPTRTPIKKFMEFKKANLNKIPPKDILQQVSFFGGGGGIICTPGSTPNKPEIASAPNDEVLMNQSTLIACEWKKGEVLKGTIIYPNGFVVTKRVDLLINEGLYYGVLNFAPGLNDPVGNYTFILEGKSGMVKDIVNFKKPVGPHLFVVDLKTIMFYGFSAQEKVRLVDYAPGTGDFIGWQEYTMDGAGQLLLVSTTPFEGYFWAVGKSGEAQLPREHPLYGGSLYPNYEVTIKNIICDDLPSRINGNRHGHIAFTKDGGNLRFHSEPGLTTPVVAKIPEGTDFLVDGGPRCANGLTWWKISTSNPNATGWVAESYKGEYLLEP